MCHLFPPSYKNGRCAGSVHVFESWINSLAESMTLCTIYSTPIPPKKERNIPALMSIRKGTFFYRSMPGKYPQTREFGLFKETRVLLAVYFMKSQLYCLTYLDAIS